MPLQPERVFDPARPVFVRRFLVAAGRHLNPGEKFLWGQWAVNERRVRQLFDAGKLTHDAPQRADLAGLQARESVASIPLTPAPTIEQEGQDDDLHHVAVTTPAADAQSAPTVENDGLDELTMAELRQIAAEENAPLRASKSAQRDAIRETRNANAAV